MIEIGGWNKITMVCGNHGDDLSNILEIKEALDTGHDSVFYTCPHYKDKYTKTNVQSFCTNRITIQDYMAVLSFLTEKRYSGMEEVDLTGFRWSKKGISYKVISCDENGNMVISMLNNKAIH